jgi:heterotetrameric sarcosine oxidase gamma subunit
MTTPIRYTPLRAVTQRLGARQIDVSGWRFPEVYTTREAEIEAARERVGLADVSPHGKLQIEGERAYELVRAVFGRAPEGVGAGLKVESGFLFRLRPDQFYMSTRPGEETLVQTPLESAARGRGWFVTVTDLTHAFGDLRLIGPASPGLLRKVCALDFHPDAFPNLTARQTSAAKTKQLIARRDFGDLPAYTLIGAQSLSAYVWEVLMEAGREFGIAPIGVGALAALER